MKLRSLLCAAATLLVLAGCASRSVPKNFALDPAKNEGIVVVSASHDPSGGRAARAWFDIDGGPATGEGGLLVSLPDAFPGIQGGSDLEDGYGKVFALSLPAGRHMITSWRVSYRNSVMIHPILAPTPLVFDVVAGQVKYIGDLHAHLLMGKSLFGLSALGNAYPEVLDEHERDIAVFDERYPQWKGKVAVDLLKLGPWTDGAGDGDRDPNALRIDPPTVMPPPHLKK
jgi:hypothetical protein